MASAFSHAFVAGRLAAPMPSTICPGTSGSCPSRALFCPMLTSLGLLLGLPTTAPGGIGDCHTRSALPLSSVYAWYRWLFVSGWSSWAWWSHVLYFFVVTASHGVLDAMTDGGRGIAFRAV